VNLRARDNRKVQRIQNYAMRFIHGVKRREAILHMYIDNGYLRTTERRVWLLMVLSYKTVIKNSGPQYISQRFNHQNIIIRLGLVLIYSSSLWQRRAL